VRRAFGRSLVTPDEVRGSFPTLRRAVIRRGWPTLDAMRGGVVAALWAEQPVLDLYLSGAPSLEGRAMFVPATPDMPSAALVKMDVPDRQLLDTLLRQHFVVRAQADAFTAEARANDSARAQKAITGGAHVVSTDFPVADPAIGAYLVALPGAVGARCNPLTAPSWCRTRDVEE